MKFTIRSTESNRSKILKMVSSGTALTVIEENKASGYTKVRAGNVEGYILTRYTSPKPISRWYLKKANKQLEELQQENKLINEGLQQLKGNNKVAITSKQTLINERDQLSEELNSLKQTAANAIQLKHQRDNYEERFISVERELKQLTLENQTLENSANQDWFLYGGILSLIGVILGFILPKLGWRRKASNWDTF
jgi:SH3 domain protein